MQPEVAVSFFDGFVLWQIEDGFRQLFYNQLRQSAGDETPNEGSDQNADRTAYCPDCRAYDGLGKRIVRAFDKTSF